MISETERRKMPEPRRCSSPGRLSGPRRRFSLAALAALSLLAGACGNSATTKPPEGNHPPTVVSLTVTPALPHARERVLASVVANDRDNDRLTYSWKASRGSFPEGYRSPAVAWLTAGDRGTDTLRVSIGDQHFLIKDSLVVSLRGVSRPDSIRFRPQGASVIMLVWGASPDHNPRGYTVTGWRGYEVFRAPRSFAEIPEGSLGDYLITPQPVPDESLAVMNLRPGNLYWFAVRSVRSLPNEDGTTWTERSGISPEVTAYSLPGGAVELREIDHPQGAQAVDLSDGGAVRALDPRDTSAVDRFDLFVGADSAHPGELALKSVSLLRGIDPAWGARRVGIKAIGTNWDARTTTDDGWAEEAELVEGEVYALKLPEGNFAKIELFDVIRGYAPYRQANLKWAYQVIPDFPHF
jgi:hypothetical protein